MIDKTNLQKVTTNIIYHSIGLQVRKLNCIINFERITNMITGRSSSSLFYTERDQQVLTDLQQMLNDLQERSRNKDQLSNYCQSLQNKVNQGLRSPQDRAPYQLLLAELYGIKLKQYIKAEDLCQHMLKDNSLSREITIETLLRLSYIQSIQGKYHHSITTLNNVSSIIKDKKQLQELVRLFCNKLFENSINSMLLNGLKAQKIDKQFQKAIDYYTQEFKLPASSTIQVQNKYFAAISIIDLHDTLPDIKFEGVSRSECEKYKERREEQEEQIHQRYQQRRQYLTIIVKFSEKNRSNLVNLKMQEQYNELQFFLAHLKLDKIFKTKVPMKKETLQQLQSFHSDLLSKKMIKKFYLVDFVRPELRTIHKMLVIRQKFCRNSAFDKLREHVQESKRAQNYQKKQIVESRILRDELSPLFEGSLMTKINSRSNGHSVRYFYYKKEDFKKSNLKLYFCANKSKKSLDNDYYDLHEVNFLTGKKSQQFQQSEYNKLAEGQCFVLKTPEREINLYVENKTEYRNWDMLFQQYQKSNERRSIKIKSTKQIPRSKSKWFNFLH